MPELEREPFSTSGEADLIPFEARRRRQHLAEHAIHDFTFLGEVQTSYDHERACLREQIIGQDAAIDAVVTALDRKDVRRASDKRPIANLAFLGPTGVGKTETAKALAEVLSSSNGKLLRINSSEFSNGHEVAMLTGSPPGYTGNEQRGRLHPSYVDKVSVVLFDEIEKGSPRLNNILLQIMDDGELQLSDGSTASFRDKVIIITSNLGAKEMYDQASGPRTGFAPPARPTDMQSLETVARRSFTEHFNPEFVNRLDDMVVFHSLQEEALHQILDVKIGLMNQEYIDTYGAFLNLTNRTRQHLVAQALAEPAYGARPLVRAIDKHVAALFGRYTAHEMIPDGSEVRVYHRDEVSNFVHKSYANDLVFAILPDDSVKLPAAPPDPTSVIFQAGAVSTSVATAPKL